MATLKATGRTTDGSEFDGTTEGTDRVVPGKLFDARYVLTSVVFYTAGTIADLEIIFWDPINDERAGKIGGSGASEQTWSGELEVPLCSDGETSMEVRVITTTQSVHLAKLEIDGFIRGGRAG